MTDHLDIAAAAAGFTIDANPSYAPGPFPNKAGSLDDAVMRAAAKEITGCVTLIHHSLYIEGCSC